MLVFIWTQTRKKRGRVTAKGRGCQRPKHKNTALRHSYPCRGYGEDCPRRMQWRWWTRRVGSRWGDAVRPQGLIVCVQIVSTHACYWTGWARLPISYRSRGLFERRSLLFHPDCTGYSREEPYVLVIKVCMRAQPWFNDPTASRTKWKRLIHCWAKSSTHIQLLKLWEWLSQKSVSSWKFSL